MRSFTVYTLFFALFSSLLLVHAQELPKNGTWTFLNVEYPKQYLNLQGGSSRPKTNVIGFHSAGPASKWILSRKGTRYVTLRNAFSDTFLDTPNESENAKVVGNTSPGIFRMIYAGNETYRFTLPNPADSDFALSLQGSHDADSVVLKPYNTGDKRQLWKLRRV